MKNNNPAAVFPFLHFLLPFAEHFSFVPALFKRAGVTEGELLNKLEETRHLLETTSFASVNANQPSNNHYKMLFHSRSHPQNQVMHNMPQYLQILQTILLETTSFASVNANQTERNEEKKQEILNGIENAIGHVEIAFTSKGAGQNKSSLSLS